MYNPAEEVVQIVDSDNRETGTALRKVMRAQGLIHRATYVLVFNGRGELFVQKRTATKDVYPGFYDIAAGGVVLAGESYRESAERELAEELGISGIELTYHFEFYHEDKGKNRVWGSVWSCVYDGDMILQKEEVESGFFALPPDILSMSQHKDFTPDGILVLKKFLSLCL